MSRSAIILRNIASNWIGTAVNAAVMFVMTPFILREIGEARYGIWILTSSIIGYYGMLDLGFRAGVNQYMTRSLAMPDYDRASAVLSTAVVVLSTLGAAMVLLSVAAAYLAPALFDLPVQAAHEAFWCLLVVGVTAGIQCALSPFASIFVAMQRFDLANLIGISSRLLMAGSIAVALSLDYGLVGLAVASGAVTILDYLVRCLVARRLVPQLKISSGRASMEQLRAVGSFGAWNFLISISRYAYLHMQPLVIASMLPIAAVGHYALVTGLWYQINSLFTSVGHVLYPVAAALDVQGDRSTLKRLYVEGSRLLLLAVIPVVLIAFVWADPFYRLWVGEKFVSGEPYDSVALLLQVLLAGTLISYSSNVAGKILTASGHIRQLSLLQVSGTVVNLIASLVLIPYMGLLGVAIASCLTIIVVDLIGVPLMLFRKSGMHAGDFARSAGFRLGSVVIVLFFWFEAVREVSQPDQWWEMILNGALGGLGAIATIAVLGLTRKERRRFLEQPVRRLLRVPAT
jgi:O-antigen/teichoic acid export membrane protein